MQWFYVIWTSLVGGFIMFKAYTSRNMHLHHYSLTMIIVSFVCYQSKFLAIAQGVFNGIMTEGTSRWGVDPIWDYFVDTNGHWIKTPKDSMKEHQVVLLKQSAMRKMHQKYNQHFGARQE